MACFLNNILKAKQKMNANTKDLNHMHCHSNSGISKLQLHKLAIYLYKFCYNTATLLGRKSDISSCRERQLGVTQKAKKTDILNHWLWIKFTQACGINVSPREVIFFAHAKSRDCPNHGWVVGKTLKSQNKLNRKHPPGE